MTGPRKRLVGQRDLLWLAIASLICALFVAVLLHYLALRHEVYRLGYQVADLTQEHGLLLEENRRLTVEVALQSSAERLEQEAIERLALQPMTSDQILQGEGP